MSFSSFSRRQFLKGTSASLVAASVPISVLRARGVNSKTLFAEALRGADEPAAIAALVARALEAAQSAGAVYADARYRISNTEGFQFGAAYPTASQSLSVGLDVRALYNGYWGYACLMGAITPDQAAALGRDATAQAKTGAKGLPRTVELAPRPIVRNGTWSTPIEVDPFAVAWDEKADVLKGIDDYFTANLPDLDGSRIGVGPDRLDFAKDETTFGSSDGASYTQTRYRSGISFAIMKGQQWRTELGARRLMDDVVRGAGAGWEYIYNLPKIFPNHLQERLAQLDAARFRKPVDIGRYDIVFDAEALAKLASINIGGATGLDRAMGYVANTVGTSYLNDPLAMLGTYRLGSPALTVTSNRSMPGGLRTVKWDDEGVEPDDAVLVKDGILTDFQTTRESASWLAPYYQKVGKPARSHGGLSGWLGRPPRQGATNLVVHPAKQNTSFQDLCSGVKRGLAVFGGYQFADQQGLNAECYPDLVYEIRNGKLGDVIGEQRDRSGAVVLLSRAPDFWKNLKAVGGPQTARQVLAYGSDGDCTVSAPAALVQNVAVTTNELRFDPVR